MERTHSTDYGHAPQPASPAAGRRGRPGLPAASAWWSVLLAALLLAFPAQLHAVTSRAFFRDGPVLSGDGRPVKNARLEPGTKRIRNVLIDPEVLIAADSPLPNPSPAVLQRDIARLGLAFFDDARFTAVVERTDYRTPTNYVSRGVIEGADGSSFLLVANGNIVALTVQVPGRGVYQVRYGASGAHRAIELDPRRIPRDREIRPRLPAAAGGELAAASTPSVAADAGDTTVDVMVVYTTAARTGAGGAEAMRTLIDLAVAEANPAYDNSEVPITLDLVHTAKVTYTETGNASTDLPRLQATSDGYMDSVHTLRDHFGADLVCLLVESMNSYAGLGYLMTSASTNFAPYGFSVIRRVYATGQYTFAHELGHNMGSTHDRGNSDSAGAYPYSYGHRFVGSDTNTYRTIMANAPGTRIPYFSNSDVSYLDTPTGVATNQTNSAHNALSLSNAAPTVARFRPTAHLISPAASPTSADDATHEDDETFRFVLSGMTNSTLQVGTNTITIVEDDRSTLGFAVSSVAISEVDGTAVVTVIRSGATNTAVSVNYATGTNGTATAGSDYVSTNGTLSFAAGETDKSISVVILTDASTESAETFGITLSSFVNTAADAITNCSVTITDAGGDEGDLGPAGLVPANEVRSGSLTLLPGNQVRVLVAGPVGTGVILEETTDLKRWTPVAGGELGAGGLEWIGTNDTRATFRYFRVVAP